MSFLPLLLCLALQSPEPDSRLVHTVFFWMKSDVTDAQKSEFLIGLRTLVEIDEIESSYVGVPADTRRPVIDSSYSFSITLIFRTKSDQDAYQSHPNHLLFIDRYSDLWERVVVYDAVSP